MSSVVTTRALMSSAGSAAWWALTPPSALPPRAGASASSSSMQTTLGARARAAAKTPAGAGREALGTACSHKVVFSQGCCHWSCSLDDGVHTVRPEAHANQLSCNAS